MLKLAIFASFLSFTVVSVLAVPEWGQCGGIGWTGSTQCDPGLVCTRLNDWYHQCLRDTAAPSSTVRPTSSQAPPTSSQAPPTSVSPTSRPPSTTASQPPPTGTGLTARLQSKGKLHWGTCADPGTLGNTQNANIIRSDFGSLTPENSMKWGNIQGSRGSFSWGNPDQLVNFATQNGKKARGHTLVWHSQLAGWVEQVNTAAALTTVIQDHVAAVVGRYRGRLYAWDVVNEMFEENGSYRNSVFNRVLPNGQFVRVAFQAARAADPACKLFINDYNLDSANAKARAVVNIVQQMNANGTQLIDGIGTQMHLSAGGAGGTLAALQLLATANVDVEITELDIIGASANDYTTVVRNCLQVPRCTAIISWGVSDRDSWRSSQSPLLFDNNFQRKAAYNAVIQALA